MENISILINSIAACKEFVLATTFIVLIGLLRFTMDTKDYRVKKDKKKMVGIFFLLSNKDILKIICAFLTFVLIFTCLLRNAPIEVEHAYLFILFVGIEVLLYIPKLYSLSIVVNRVLQGVAVVVLSVILDYVQNIRYDQRFMIVYVVGAVIVVLYSFYVFMMEVLNISKGRVKKNES